MNEDGRTDLPLFPDSTTTAEWEIINSAYSGKKVHTMERNI